MHRVVIEAGFLQQPERPTIVVEPLGGANYTDALRYNWRLTEHTAGSVSSWAIPASTEVCVVVPAATSGDAFREVQRAAERQVKIANGSVFRPRLSFCEGFSAGVSEIGHICAASTRSSDPRRRLQEQEAQRLETFFQRKEAALKGVICGLEEQASAERLRLRMTEAGHRAELCHLEAQLREVRIFGHLQLRELESIVWQILRFF